MSSVKDVIHRQLQDGKTLIDMLTKDMSESECFVAPLDGANHVGWILGHIACTEDWAVAAMTGSPCRIASSVRERFEYDSICLPDASRYPSRAEIDQLFRAGREAMVETLQAFDEGKWDDPPPEGMPGAYFPTSGVVWAKQVTHQFWHIGQITVCRTALGKPRVLGEAAD